MKKLLENERLIDDLNLVAIALAGLGTLVIGVIVCLHGPAEVVVAAFLPVMLGSALMIPVALARRRPVGGIYMAVLLTVAALVDLIFQIVTL